MIKYFCDICGKEINEEWIQRMDISADTISQFRDGNTKPAQLHFHRKCLSNMLQYLDDKSREESDDQNGG